MMTVIAGELNNPIIFKQYLLRLLEEDTLFKQQFLTTLFERETIASLSGLKTDTATKKQVNWRKHNIGLAQIEALQALFDDQPSAAAILDDIKKPID